MEHYDDYVMYPTGREISFQFEFRFFAYGKFAKFKPLLLLCFRNLSMIAYMIESQKIKIRLNSIP